VPAVNLQPSDLTAFAQIDDAKAMLMIEDALALAARVAPCILESTFEYDAAARAILRGAILRWNESGTGAVVQQSAGPFAHTLDTRQQRRGMFWPSEIEQLQDLCKGAELSGAWSYDTAPPIAGLLHDPMCHWHFGSLCTCGVITY
jgi:hypothetical protein